MKLDFVCQHCGTLFIPKVKSHEYKYCSQECYRDARLRQHGLKHPIWKGYGKRIFKCLNCGKVFVRYYHPSQPLKFCSKTCMVEFAIGDRAFHWKGGPPKVTCFQCGGTFIDPKWNGTRKFCSQQCSAEYMSVQRRADGNPAWKGGITAIINTWESRREYKLSKKIALKRDGYKCRNCGKGGRLHVHHVIPIMYFVKKYGTYERAVAMNDDPHRLDNLITLCSKCHRKVENNREVKNNKTTDVPCLAQVSAGAYQIGH